MMVPPFSLWHRIAQRLAGLTLLLTCAPGLHAQEPPPDNPQVEGEQAGRIVEGRPRLYFVKRAAHPLTWVEAGTAPVVHLGERLGRGGGPAVFPLIWPRHHETAGIQVGMGTLGGGSGLGPSITPFYKDPLRGIEVEAPLIFTYHFYQQYQLNTRVPLMSGGPVDRLDLDVLTGYSSRAADNFFGIGNDTRTEKATQYRTVSREAAVGFSARLRKTWTAGLHAAYRNVGVTRPRGDRSAQTSFESADVPGLATGAVLHSLVLSAARDTKDDKLLPTSGGLQGAEVSLNEGAGKGDFSYWKYRIYLQRYFSLSSDKRKVVALRAMGETNQEKGGSHVPFFDMPTIGSWDNLRGFDNYRFYDKSVMSFGAEYRYRMWREFDWALFVDAGQVAPEPGDFGLHRFHTGYGVRFIVRANPKLPITMDFARSNEAWRFYLNLAPNF